MEEPGEGGEVAEERRSRPSLVIDIPVHEPAAAGGGPSPASPAPKLLLSARSPREVASLEAYEAKLQRAEARRLVSRRAACLAC